MLIQRAIRITAIVLLAAFVLVLLRSIPDLVRIGRAFSLARDRIHQAEVQWQRGGDRAALRVGSLLSEAQAALRRAREVAESTPLLRYVPGVGSLLRTTATFAASGVEYTEAAGRVTSIMATGRTFADRYADRSIRSLTSRERIELLAVAGSSLHSARTALAAFDRGDQLLRGVPCPRLLAWLVAHASLCRDGRLAKDLLPLGFHDLRSEFTAAASVGESVFALAGSDRGTDVLLLFLNDMELRPGGGFLGTYGIATLRRGELAELTTDDVYNLDRRVEGELRIPPPEPFRRHGIVTWWYLRDANWSPDFARSTEDALAFYRRERGPGNPQFVIGFTTRLASDLLRLVGPVTVSGTRFTAENVADELEYQVEKGYFVQGIPMRQRKGIIAPLSRTVVDRLIDRPLREWAPVIDALRTAARERHLMAYAVDPKLQASVERFGVAGRVRPAVAGEDSLMVIDANLGALKTDPVVARDIRYGIIPDGNGYRALVRLRYRNTGTFTWKTTRYRTYTRVYLPEGSELLTVRGAMLRDRSDDPGPVDRGTEFGRTWFGAFVSVEPGAERTLALEVKLAPPIVARIRQGSYGLDVQKQLGSRGMPLTVDLEFGTPVVRGDPAEPPAAWGDGRYAQETDLRVDRKFQVTLHRSR